LHDDSVEARPLELRVVEVRPLELRGRQIFLNHGRVQIDLPRLMTDDQLAEVLESSSGT
jgi:hypothetical protein